MKPILNNDFRGCPLPFAILIGSLTVDFPEEVKVTPSPDEYQVIEMLGSNLKLSWCSIEQALDYLRDQYAVGTLTAKIVQPIPFKKQKKPLYGDF